MGKTDFHFGFIIAIHGLCHIPMLTDVIFPLYESWVIWHSYHGFCYIPINSHHGFCYIPINSHHGLSYIPINSHHGLSYIPIVYFVFPSWVVLYSCSGCIIFHSLILTPIMGCVIFPLWAGYIPIVYFLFPSWIVLLFSYSGCIIFPFHSIDSHHGLYYISVVGCH